MIYSAETDMFFEPERVKEPKWIFRTTSMHVSIFLSLEESLLSYSLHLLKGPIDFDGFSIIRKLNDLISNAVVVNFYITMERILD